MLYTLQRHPTMFIHILNIIWQLFTCFMQLNRVVCGWPHHFNHVVLSIHLCMPTTVYQNNPVLNSAQLKSITASNFNRKKKCPLIPCTHVGGYAQQAIFARDSYERLLSVSWLYLAVALHRYILPTRLSDDASEGRRRDGGSHSDDWMQHSLWLLASPTADECLVTLVQHDSCIIHWTWFPPCCLFNHSIFADSYTDLLLKSLNAHHTSHKHMPAIHANA